MFTLCASKTTERNLVPAFQTRTSIIISHPILGKGPTSQRLGSMSLELAMYLKYKFAQELAIKRGDLTAEQARESMLKGTVGSDTYDMHSRCLLAGTQYYEPALLTVKPIEDSEMDRTGRLLDISRVGRLTETGYTTYEIYQQLLIEHASLLEAGDPEKSYLNPRNWTKAEHLIINGEISLRQLKTLKVLDEAIQEAEQANRTSLTEEFLVGDFGRKADRQLNEIDPMLVDPFLKGAQRQQTQTFQGFIPQGAPNAYVPTKIFGQRAKTDLKVLCQFGLVNLKAYITGQRGRPAHIVRVSPTGRVLWVDLAQRGVI